MLDKSLYGNLCVGFISDYTRSQNWADLTKFLTKNTEISPLSTAIVANMAISPGENPILEATFMA